MNPFRLLFVALFALLAAAFSPFALAFDVSLGAIAGASLVFWFVLFVVAMVALIVWLKRRGVLKRAADDAKATASADLQSAVDKVVKP